MTNAAQNRNLWNNIMKGSYFVFLIAFFIFLGLAFHYLSTLKAVPDVKTGAIYPLNIHGWIVYLNRQQHVLLNGLETISVACAVVAVAIKLLVLRRKS